MRRHIENGVLQQISRLRGGVFLEEFGALASCGGHSIVVPGSSTIAAVLAELNVIDMRTLTVPEIDDLFGL